MKRRSKELQQAKKEGRKPHGGFGGGGGYGGGGIGSKSYSSSESMQSYESSITKPSYTPTTSKSVGATALKLGKKNKDIDSFVKKIEMEGQRTLVS